MNDEVDGCIMVTSRVNSRKCVDTTIKEVNVCDSEGEQIIWEGELGTGIAYVCDVDYLVCGCIHVAPLDVF